jgi:hypothetical protein
LLTVAEIFQTTKLFSRLSQSYLDHGNVIFGYLFWVKSLKATKILKISSCK